MISSSKQFLTICMGPSKSPAWPQWHLWLLWLNVTWLVLDAPAFRDCQPLNAMLLTTPFVGTSLFGEQFQSSVKEATCSKEQLSQVRRLVSADTRLLRALQVPELASSHRSVGLPPPPPHTHTVKVAFSRVGGSVPKRCWCKNRGSKRSGGAPAQQGARGQGVSNKRPPTGRHWWLDPVTSSHSTHWVRWGVWSQMIQCCSGHFRSQRCQQSQKRKAAPHPPHPPSKVAFSEDGGWGRAINGPLARWPPGGHFYACGGGCINLSGHARLCVGFTSRNST